MEIIHQSIVLLLFREGFITVQTLDDNAIIFGSLLQICYRCSVFCNLVLAVSRTVMIIKPFYQIKIGAVKLVCILYVVPWMILCGVNIHEFYFKGPSYTFFYWIYQNGTTVGIGLIAINIYNVITVEFLAILIILPDVLAFIPPVIIIIITCIIQVITLRRSNQFPTSSNQRHVTITVLLMSTLFTICNSPFSFYIMAYVYALITGNTELENKIYKIHNLLTLFVTVLPMLNATLNPVILISRSSGMRRKFVELTQKMARWIRRG